MTNTHSLYVAAQAQGLPEIEEGRIFILYHNEYGPGSLVPPVFSENMTLNGKACTIYIAGKEMPVNCPVCGMHLKRQVVAHTYEWMEMVFACPEHPYTVWIDCFPKANGQDTSWDMTNALPEYVDTQKQIAIDAIGIACDGIIKGGMTPLTRYQTFVKDAPLQFTLTRNGLVPIQKSMTENFHHWLRRLFRFPWKTRAAQRT